MVRSTLKLNAAISAAPGPASELCWPKTKNGGGPGSIMNNMHFLAINRLFRSRRALLPQGNETVRHVDSSGINRLAVRLQKLHFMKSLFSQNSKVQKRKIEILVGIRVFVEDSKSLLPTFNFHDAFHDYFHDYFASRSTFS